MDHEQLLEDAKAEVERLLSGDSKEIDASKRKVVMLARKIFGENTHYLKELEGLRYAPMFHPASDESYATSRRSGLKGLRNVVQTMLDELKSFPVNAAPSSQSVSTDTSEIFIVHGHDEEMKLSVARTLTKLDLSPIILHEQPNIGRTLIEKFEDHAEVGFAIVLLSPEDIACKMGEDFDLAMTRARQNVVFELGYFIGRLGRHRVFPLFRQHERFEMPSDFSGVTYVPYDAVGRWQFDLVRELKASGYPVDANKLM